MQHLHEGMNVPSSGLRFNRGGTKLIVSCQGPMGNLRAFRQLQVRCSHPIILIGYRLRRVSTVEIMYQVPGTGKKSLPSLMNDTL